MQRYFYWFQQLLGTQSLQNHWTFYTLDSFEFLLSEGARKDIWFQEYSQNRYFTSGYGKGVKMISVMSEETSSVKATLSKKYCWNASGSGDIGIGRTNQIVPVRWVEKEGLLDKYARHWAYFRNINKVVWKRVMRNENGTVFCIYSKGKRSQYFAWYVQRFRNHCRLLSTARGWVSNLCLWLWLLFPWKLSFIYQQKFYGNCISVCNTWKQWRKRSIKRLWEPIALYLYTRTDVVTEEKSWEKPCHASMP